MFNPVLSIDQEARTFTLHQAVGVKELIKMMKRFPKYKKYQVLAAEFAKPTEIFTYTEGEWQPVTNAQSTVE